MANQVQATPWLTARQAAKRLQSGVKLVYHEVASGRLRAAKIGGKRAIRIKAEWVDAYREGMAAPIEGTPQPLRRLG